MANDGQIVQVEGYPAIYMADYSLNVFSAETVLTILEAKQRENKILIEEIRQIKNKIILLENNQ